MSNATVSGTPEAANVFILACEINAVLVVAPACPRLTLLIEYLPSALTVATG